MSTDNLLIREVCNYIGGQFVPPISGSYLDSFEPATGKVWARIPDSDHRDVDAAVLAAGKAFPE